MYNSLLELIVGVWRRLVARYLGVVEAVGSSPVTPTMKIRNALRETKSAADFYFLAKRRLEATVQQLTSFGICSKIADKR